MPDTGEKKRIPQVFVVDSQAFPSQASGRQDVPRLQLMNLLLAAALIGVILEAGCICHLYSLYSRHMVSASFLLHRVICHFYSRHTVSASFLLHRVICHLYTHGQCFISIA